MVQKISEIEDSEDGVRPVIVQFQNSELQEGEEKNLKIGLYKKSRHEKLVAAATKNILYLGSINRKKDKHDLYNRFLLTSNRKTGKVRLMAVDSAIMTAQFARKENDFANSANATVHNLNKQFGSKKIKRITEQRERLKMNIDDVKEQLEQTVAGIQVNENESFVEPTNTDSLYKPPIHRNASTKEEVYVLEELVPDEVLNSLDEKANEVLSSDSDALELCDFTKQLLELQDPSASNIVDKCKLLLYLDCLIKFLLKPAKSITNKLVICNFSDEANKHILNNFSVAIDNRRTRPISYRDKTICYIMVLGMFISDYELNLEDLAKTIKLSVKKLQEMSRVLAFSVHGKKKTVMVLKIPLPSLVSLSPRKRKRN